MKTRKFWKPVIASVIVAPIALFLGIASGGVGHGDYLAAMILFPYTMLSAAVFDSITLPFIILAIIQFPLYGGALGYANEKDRLGWMIALLCIVHGIAVAAMFLVANKDFS
jgi:hypothetical protein